MLEILKIFVLAMTPIGELRLAIPIALTIYKLNWFTAYLAAVLGNLVPALFLLLFLEPAVKWFRARSNFFTKFSDWFFTRTRNKIGDRVKKHGWLALIPFVAIPLPITGVWTGALAAFLFKIPFKKAFLSIAAGAAMAGIIVSLITFAGIAVEQLFGWKALFIVISLVFITFVLKFKIRYLKFIKNLKFKI